MLQIQKNSLLRTFAPNLSFLLDASKWVETKNYLAIDTASAFSKSSTKLFIATGASSVTVYFSRTIKFFLEEHCLLEATREIIDMPIVRAIVVGE